MNQQTQKQPAESPAEIYEYHIDLEDRLDLDRAIPYDGSIPFLRSVGLSLGYAVIRIAAHHFMHAGEIVTIRSRLGHALDEEPDWGRSLI